MAAPIRSAHRTSLPALLFSAAERAPESPAIVAPDSVTTYESLVGDVARAASLLHAEGVGAGDRVAVHLHKSPSAIQAIFAALTAGSAYVPLDPTAPLLRNAQVLRDAQPKVLFTESALLADALSLVDGHPTVTVVMDSDPPADGPSSLLGRSALEAQSADDTPRSVDCDDDAYVLYTSGSTGRPKGVTVTHRAARSFVDWAAREVGLTGHDRVASVAPLQFDLSVFDLFAGASAGACVVLVPHDVLLLPQLLPGFVRSMHPSVWYSVPSVWTRTLEYGRPGAADLASLRAILFAGEVFPARHLRRLMALVPTARFLNLYGPTETNVCTWHEVDSIPSDDDRVPIGRPIDDTLCRAVGSDGRPVAVGDEGELWVSGPTLMRGYWGALEAPTTFMDGSSVGLGCRAYRTGDIVRQRASGEFEFVGRRDDQIKSAGHRIELGDVEAAFASCPAVVEAAALAVPNGEAGALVEVFVVLVPGQSMADVREHVRARVPTYMLPSSTNTVDALPRTATGKVDRTALQSLR